MNFLKELAYIIDILGTCEHPSHNIAKEAYEHRYGKSKYKTIYEQIDDLKYDDIIIRIDKYPLINVSNFHIDIISKEGYGVYSFVTTINIYEAYPIPTKELDSYIKHARKFFKYNKVNNNKNSETC